MATQKTQTTFANTYNDDYSDSDNYYKVLFNNGRALQQRELNQLQSIIQTDLKINADFSYKQGQAAVGGQTSVKNQSKFIKLNTDTTAGGFALPTDLTTVEGKIFDQTSPAIKFRVNKAVPAAGSDPAVLYVTYIDGADQDGEAAEGISITPGQGFDVADNNVPLISITGEDATGTGTLFEVSDGKFYLDGHFVHTAKQTLVLSKFTSTYSGTVGFIVAEEIITTDDDQDLFDNSGVNLNLASPGADRFKISLTLIDKADTEPGDYFFPIAEIARGAMFRDNAQANAIESRDLNDTLAQRTYEESGNYTTNKMFVDFETNGADAAKVDMIVSPSTAYVNGYRHSYISDIPITIDKPRTLQTISSSSSSASYGNYVVATTMKGIMRVDQFGQVNLRDAITHGGNTIGQARVRAIEEFGTDFKIYLFDIIMAASKNFGMVKSIGTSTIIYGDVNRDNTGVAAESGLFTNLEDASNNDLFFPVSKDRPRSISEMIVTTQHRLTATTSGTTATLTSSSIGSDYVFDDTSGWIGVLNSSGVVDTNMSVALNSDATTATITNLTSAADHTFLVYAFKTGDRADNKANHKTKTLTTVAAAGITPATIDGIANCISLSKTDIYDIVSITKSSVDISDRYILDNGQKDNFYDIGKLILKAGSAAPSGDVTVSFRYFAHGADGDFFSVNSYLADLAYEDVPSHRTKSGQTIELREVLDFRPVRATQGLNFHTGTSNHIFPLPRVGDTLTYKIQFYLGQKGIAYVHESGKVGIELGDAEEFPKYPKLDKSYLKLARCHLFPYMLSDEDVYVSHMDNRRYTMRDIGNIEKRVDEIEELTSLNMLETETNGLTFLDASGNSRLKSGITADNFSNHVQSDTTLADYRASIDPARNELRPEHVTRPIELVYDHAASTNAVLKGDKVMLSYTESTYREQASASRQVSVNPFGTERQTGTIVMSPASDNWLDTTVIASRVTKGDTSFDIGEGKSFGDWDFNWSGITEDQLANFKAGDIVGERVVDGGTYKKRVAYQDAHDNAPGGFVTRYNSKSYNKRTYQNYNISGISTVRETCGTTIKNVLSIGWMRSRFISFKATGLRPNTEFFGFFNKINVSAFMKTSEGTGGFVRWGALARTSPYLEVANIYGAATGYPGGTFGGATAKMLTDAHGAISGYFLLPNTTGVTTTSGNTLKFKTGRQIFTLLDISAYNVNNATSIAEFIYEANGVLNEVEENVRETRIVQIGSASASRDSEIVRVHQKSPHIGVTHGPGGHTGWGPI